MVLDRISEPEAEKAGLDKEYAQKLKEYKEMEKQLSVMMQYMENKGIRSRETARFGKKAEQDR